ncbi:MAG: hypothetical protein HC778_02875 [Chamaesiphon sp. CSU_1_12]|nr:hypothetical protein [Chamaesiphon sp. CSU_1_12]
MKLAIDVSGDAPTPTALAVWSGHLSPVKDIKIFLQGTPFFPLRHFIVRNTSRPTCHFESFFI